MRRRKRRRKKGLRILTIGTWKAERVVVESLWDQMECRFYEEMWEEQGRGGHLSRVFWERRFMELSYTANIYAER